MARPSRRLVIDATVIRAAGARNATNAESIRCRDLLQLVLESSHHCVVGAALRREWQDHASGFSSFWIRRMYARSKISGFKSNPEQDRQEHIRAALDGIYPPAAWPEIAKDIHLIEAALANDRVIISADKRARRAFAAACQQIREIGPICWVEPATHGDLLFRWLRGDAAAPRDWNLDPARESA